MGGWVDMGGWDGWVSRLVDGWMGGYGWMGGWVDMGGWMGVDMGG